MALKVTGLIIISLNLKHIPFLLLCENDFLFFFIYKWRDGYCCFSRTQS